MKNSIIQKIVLIISVCTLTTSSWGQVKTGIDILKESQFKLLKGKRVGLITNPTGVDKELNSTIDILFQAPNVKLVALYGPEHGVRGDVHAGDHVETFEDKKTGLPVYSLYGKTRKATKEMLQNIDVLVYDIQDIGCRSYTYISTLGLSMEAAAEHNIEVVVLDRPNPLGDKIEGNLTEDKFISFVSQFKIPYLYGLTCGELSQMLNQEKMIGKKCKLTVVKMEGWNRKMRFEETGLPWVLTSPHIPQPASAVFYPVTGILGELGYVSVGVGYTLPFEIIAADWINADTLATALNNLKLDGILFRPIHVKPFYNAFQGKNIQGVQIYISDFTKARLSDIQFHIMEAMNHLWPDKAVFDHANKDRFNMFDKVSGSDYIRTTFSKSHKFSDIKDYWTKDEESFRRKAQQYYLYE